MAPNLKFFVLLVISIFAALGVGIYFGFTLDAQNLIVDQREDIIREIEERFDYLSNENQELKATIESILDANKNYEYFIDSIYEETIKNKLSGLNVVIIETNNDYMYSGVGSVLNVAGANLTSLITINDKFLDEQMLINLYNRLGLEIPEGDIVEYTVGLVTESVIEGKPNILVSELNNEEFVKIVGLINTPVDYIIIAGGSLEAENERINKLDRSIVSISRKKDIGIIGIEKLDVIYSYIGNYKKFNIPTVDNIDTTMGKVSLILAMEGRPGHYGLKETAEELVPNLELPFVQHNEVRQGND
ncbi:MAG: copper transporter [Tissierellia bacterium]|nr:copper transporter [Tissierellia bacterium]